MLSMILVRNEHFKEYISKYPITSFLVLVNTLAFIYTSLNGGFLKADFSNKLGGISLASLEQHQYYRLFSYAFLHGSVGHFAFNFFAMIIFCPPIEKGLGSIKYIILFFASVLGCAFSDLFISSLMGIDFLSVGSSGFVFGIFGIYIAIILFGKTLIDKDSRNALLFFIGIAWLLPFIVGKGNLFGHLGGFVFGFVVGIVFLKTKGIKAMH